jgi:hypothetical protein
MKNTLAYYDTELMTYIECFWQGPLERMSLRNFRVNLPILLETGANPTKLFTVVIYDFS